MGSINIEKLDKNFAEKKSADGSGMIERNILNGDFGVYGIFFDEERGGFARMPLSESKKVSTAVQGLSATTAGGRIRFSTDSTKIGLSLKYVGLTKMNNMSVAGNSGFTLLEELDGARSHVTSFIPTSKDELSFYRVHDIMGEEINKTKRMRNYILYCPLYNSMITEISIVLEEDAKITKGIEYKKVNPIVYYGSSITQGGCVSRGDNAYQGFIEKWNNVDFINLGFSGNCKAELTMADYVASLNPSVFVFDYDHNAPSSEFLKNTHYPFYKRFRELCPETPIVFMSAPDFFPEMIDHKKRIAVIRGNYKKALSGGDENVYFVSGATIFGKADKENCTVDKCHPNDLGHYRMAKNLYKTLKNLI